MLKRYTATIRVDVEAESIESRDDVLDRLVDRVNKKPPTVYYDDVGLGAIKKASVTRVRPKKR
jgi:hypothetical protein